MPSTVVKFGGSNLKHESDINRIIKAIKAYDKPLIIVVSAFYGVTDSLLQLLEFENLKNRDYIKYLGEMHDSNITVAEKHIACQTRLKSYKNTLNERIGELYQLFDDAVNYGKLEYLKDEISSYGERLSSLLLTNILEEHQLPCKEALPENFGLLTDGVFSNGTVNIKSTSKRIRNYFDPLKTYVIPGFYGISPSGHVNLLGRGGSDYTAAIMAVCLNAESVDLWKDVQGFCTADPKIVADTKVIENLSYDEAAELAYFGSKIIHPRTIGPLTSVNIPLRIFNIHQFDKQLIPQTVINGHSMISNDRIKSIACSDNFGVVELHGESVGLAPGVLGKASSAMELAGINIKSVFTSQTVINFLLDQSDLRKAIRSLNDLGIPSIHQIKKKDNVSLIAAVGKGILEQHGIAARLFTAAARSKINIETIVLGASQVAVYFIVRKENKGIAVKKIHEEFFNRVSDLL